MEEGASAHSICQSEGNLISGARIGPPSLATRQIYFSVDAGHWCASMALLAARHSVSQARTSRFLPLTLLRELALEEIPELCFASNSRPCPQIPDDCRMISLDFSIVRTTVLQYYCLGLSSTVPSPIHPVHAKLSMNCGPLISSRTPCP